MKNTDFGRGVQHLPDRDLLLNILSYNPNTGELRWKKRDGPQGDLFGWNKRHAGKVAGHLHKSGYIRINIGGTVFLAHRLIFLMEYGYCPKYIDHKNRKRDDNRKLNLMEATKEENSNNQGMSKANTSGVKNVSWFKANSKWGVTFRIDGKQKFFGLFEDFQEAVSRANEIREKLGKRGEHERSLHF